MADGGAQLVTMDGQLLSAGLGRLPAQLMDELGTPPVEGHDIGLE